MTDNQSIFGMTDEGLNREELGVSETFITVFDTTPTSQKQNIKYSSIKLINEVNIVNSVQPLQILSMVLVVRIGLTTEDQTKHADAFQLLFRCFEDFDILINKGFLNDKENLTSILPTVQFEVICNRFTSEEETEEVVKNGRENPF